MNAPAAPTLRNRSEPQPPASKQAATPKIEVSATEIEETAKKPRKIDWVNTLFIGSAHLLALWGVLHMIFVQFSWWTVGLGLVWMGACSVSITGGYHRLFSHPTYKAIAPLRLFYLLFGAASAQNSALKWSSDHRIHHTKTDTEEDPYNILQGFWWAHVGWVLHKESDGLQESRVKDLSADPLIRFQHRWYIPLAILMGVLLPAGLGMLWGDALGAVLIAGFLRLVIQWHATFSVNSFAHYVGSRPYCLKGTARDSFLTALITLGEGYHNFHHRFQSDYRNGVRWHHFDPTKWWVFVLSKVGVCRDLKRVPKETIQRAREAVLAETRSTALPS